MKRLLAYLFLVLGLLWCNVGFAEKINLYCSGKVDRGNKIESFFEEFEIGTDGSDIPYLRIINQSHPMGRNNLWERNMEKKKVGPSVYTDLVYEFDQKDKTIYMSSKYKYKTKKGSVWDVSVKERITLHSGIFSMRVVFGVTGNWEKIFKFRGDCDTSALLASLKKNKVLAKVDDKIFTTNEKYYALVIGNNNYKYLEKLDAAENDAKVLAGILKKNYNFNVELLLNADYETTVDSLHNISKKLTKDDNLLIFYAGHGELDKKQNRGYWLPVDASYEKRSRWISNATVADELKATDAKHVLLIVDSCFSGSLMRSGSNIKSNKNLDAKYIKLLQKKKTRLVITSGGNEPVMDSDGGLHSVFAQKLIDTLKENNNVISTQIIFENIRKYVVVNAAQTPERAAIYKAGHDGGDFLFFAKN